jgi:hypothetical protein
MDSGLAPSARPGMTKNSDFAERRPMIVVGPDRHRARRKPHCPKRRYHRDVHDDPHGLNPPGPTVVGSAPGTLSGKTGGIAARPFSHTKIVELYLSGNSSRAGTRRRPRRLLVQIRTQARASSTAMCANSFNTFILLIKVPPDIMDLGFALRSFRLPGGRPLPSPGLTWRVDNPIFRPDKGPRFRATGGPLPPLTYWNS